MYNYSPRKYNIEYINIMYNYFSRKYYNYGVWKENSSHAEKKTLILEYVLDSVTKKICLISLHVITI